MSTSRRLLPLLILSALAATSCQDIVNAVVPCATLAVGDASVQRVMVEGIVRAPRKWVPNTVEPTSGAPLDEVRVPQATVILADALGSRVPGLEPAQTDTQGSYRLNQVPVGYTYQVVAAFQTPDSKQAIVRTMVRTTASKVTVDVASATTLVTTDLVKTMDGFSTNFDATRFESAVAIARRQLTDTNVPDLTQPDAVQAMIATMLNFNPELTGHMNQLKQELATQPTGSP